MGPPSDAMIMALFQRLGGLMNRCLIGLGLLLFVSSAFSQGSKGAISGTVTFQGVAAAAATVQAKDTSTGVIYKVTTAKTGSFTIANLPAGSYEVSVPRLGLSTN